MRQNRKPIGRWIGEAILIFVSVFGAFYLDNLRGEKQQEREYLQHLEDLRNDLLTNQGKFNYELNPVARDPYSGYIDKNLSLLTYVDSIVHIPTREHADTLLKMVNDRSIIGLSEWIFASSQYDMLSKQFFSYIQNDSLKNNLERHFRNHLSRTNYKDAINAYIGQFEDICDDLDLSAGPNQYNRNILFGNQSVNKIRRISNSYEGLKSFTQLVKSNDSILLKNVESELRFWNVDF